MTTLDDLIDLEAYDNIFTVEDLREAYTDEELLRICYLLVDSFLFGYHYVRSVSHADALSKWVDERLVHAGTNYARRASYIRWVMENDPEFMAMLDLIQ